MQENELDKLIKKQLDVCKEATDFAVASSDLLKRAITRIYELENLVYNLKQSQSNKEKNKKKKQKKKKDK